MTATTSDDERPPFLPKGAFFSDDPYNVDRVYGCGRRREIEAMVPCAQGLVGVGNIDDRLSSLREVEVIFSTWGMPILNASQIAGLPRLRALFYAAGTVQSFARPYLERGVTVVSAWSANATAVAEFTLAQILLANKGYFRNSRESHGQYETEGFRGKGNFGLTVALLGAGAIGRKVIELLRRFDLRIVVFDPYLSDKKANELGVRKVSLEEAFRQGDVVSNHLADLPATVGLIKRVHLQAMPLDATFINTGRAATVVDEDLFAVMRARPDLTALLDVFNPQRVDQERRLANVHFSTHIAGSIGNEVVRMADCVIAEFKRWRDGVPLHHAVSLNALNTMA